MQDSHGGDKDLANQDDAETLPHPHSTMETSTPFIYIFFFLSSFSLPQEWNPYSSFPEEARYKLMPPGTC